MKLDTLMFYLVCKHCLQKKELRNDKGQMLVHCNAFQDIPENYSCQKSSHLHLFK